MVQPSSIETQQSSPVLDNPYASDVRLIIPQAPAAFSLDGEHVWIPGKQLDYSSRKGRQILGDTLKQEVEKGKAVSS